MNPYRHSKQAMAFALVFTAFLPTQALADAAKAGLEIAKKNDLANQGFGSERSVMEMKLINAHGDVTTRRMRSEIIEGKDDGDKSIVIFGVACGRQNSKCSRTQRNRATTNNGSFYRPSSGLSASFSKQVWLIHGQ